MLLDDRGRGAVQFAEHPAVEFAALAHGPIPGSAGQTPRLQLVRVASEPVVRGKAVDVGIDHEEAVHIPQPQQELRNAVLDRRFAVADGRPGGWLAKKYQRSASAP